MNLQVFQLPYNILLLFLSPPWHPIRIIVDTPEQELPMCTKFQSTGYGTVDSLNCAVGSIWFACGWPISVQLTHPTQTICFQQTPNQMKSVLQPSTILFTRRFETKDTAQTQCTNSAGNATCLLCRHRDHCLFQERLDSSSMKLAV